MRLGVIKYTTDCDPTGEEEQVQELKKIDYLDPSKGTLEAKKIWWFWTTNGFGIGVAIVFAVAFFAVFTDLFCETIFKLVIGRKRG